LIFSHFCGITCGLSSDFLRYYRGNFFCKHLFNLFTLLNFSTYLFQIRPPRNFQKIWPSLRICFPGSITGNTCNDSCELTIHAWGTGLGKDILKKWEAKLKIEISCIGPSYW
jgi:hypothetical protein